MPRVLVTGPSGAGKSAALAALGERGFEVVDTDDPGWREYRPYPRPLDALHCGEWWWVEARMRDLLDRVADAETLFVGGAASNQAAFYDRFDAVVLLSAPAEVLLDRVASRTSNAYGKTEIERAEILADLAEVGPALREGCTHELDATRPLPEIVAELMAIASAASTRRARLSRARPPGSGLWWVRTPAPPPR